ncbi:MAG: hypothetical protein IJX62_02665 [Clostridia bacterium]|nr:hypothetical protein [Clostridia bacterium]
MISILLLVCMVLPVIFEISWHGDVTWSGYVFGGVLLAYVWLILPCWFKKPNPAIFVPTTFAAIMLYLLYINLKTDGRWFLSFAFPVVGVLGLIVTATATLINYLRRGRLYIFGGCLIALGGWTMLIELFIYLTFHYKAMVAWSLCSCVTLFLFGMMLIVIAIVKPLKESLRRIFFIG